MGSPLREYNRKRDFSRTPEPSGSGSEARKPKKALPEEPRLVVVQKHHASHLHYDFRLELDGVLKSWAVPKGPSLNPAVKRLALHVEDHPFDYKDFEGVIPNGNYGAGHVIVWDRGTWRWNPPGDGKIKSPKQALAKGKLDFFLDTEKLKGRFVLARSGRPRQWMLIKVKDEHARKGSSVTDERPESVVTGRTIEDLKRGAPGEARWSSHDGLELSRVPRMPELEDVLDAEELARVQKAKRPTHVEPMLATLVDEAPEDEDRRGRWLFEIKLDGIRALAFKQGNEVRLVSRRGNPLENAFPEVARAVARLAPDACVLDGEICILDPEGRSRFQLIQPRIHLASGTQVERLARETPAVFFAFDLLHVEGNDLRKVPIEGRKKVLAKLLPEDDPVLRPVDHVEEHGRELLEIACEKGLEGLVAKRAGSAYRGGRSDGWLKVKCGRTATFAIGGYARYDTTSAGAIGGLLLGLYRNGNLQYVGGAGTGFDEKMRRALAKRLDPLEQKSSPFEGVKSRRDLKGTWRGKRPEKIVWVSPELVCECRYAEFTDGEKARHVTFLGLRDDVRPEECGFPQPSPSPAKRGRAGEGAGAIDRPKLTNAKKVFFPEDGITKGDLFEFYERVAPVLLPHLRDRPMVLRRLPNGIHGQSFYQKNLGPEAPRWIKTESIWSQESRRFVRYAIVNDVGALLYCIQLGCISLSPWTSRVGSLENPDFSIIDLDPGDDCTFEQVVDCALLVKELLDEIGLRGYPKTSGASGLHVEIPLETRYSYDDARLLAEVIATTCVERRPDLCTIVRGVKARPRDRIYVDYLQNVIGKTVVGPYSVREQPKAPVSTPLRWREVKPTLRPEHFTVRNFHERVAKVGDLWLPVLEDKQSIEKAVERLQEKKPKRRRRSA